VGVDRSIPRSAREVLVLLLGDVLLGLGVPLTFGQSEVHDVDRVLVLGESDQEIVGFDVPIDEVVCVHLLQPLQHLFGQHEHCLEVELAGAEGEEFLQ